MDKLRLPENCCRLRLSVCVCRHGYADSQIEVREFAYDKGVRQDGFQQKNMLNIERGGDVPMSSSEVGGGDNYGLDLLPPSSTNRVNYVPNSTNESAVDNVPPSDDSSMPPSLGGRNQSPFVDPLLLGNQER
mmetsp:Transcript_11732/g.19802  ORF Transcript_11732/g.19802 Transcript_11732/m.19802 type:complete len:132 (-) Transcript_11732:145-540(-)